MKTEDFHSRYLLKIFILARKEGCPTNSTYRQERFIDDVYSVGYLSNLVLPEVDMIVPEEPEHCS